MMTGAIVYYSAIFFHYRIETTIMHALVSFMSHVCMQGAERFADYGGYGESLQYNGEHTEQSFVCDIHIHVTQ